MLEVFFLRHAESVGNLQGIMQGRRDYVLSEKGLRQAEQLATYLDSCLFEKHPPDALYASPLQRTLQTLAPFRAKRPELPFATHDSLLEVDSGIFSGLTWEEALAKHPEDCARFKAARDWGAVPEGESKAHLWERARSLIADLQTRHPEGGRVVLMTHGGLIRAALGVLAGIHPDEKIFLCIDNASLSLTAVQGERRLIRYVNDTRYLQPCDYQADFVP